MRGVFSTLHRHTVLQGATSELQKTFGLGVPPTPLPLDLVERLHGMVDFASRHIAVTQANMNVNNPTPQPRDVTYDVHVTQVNMNVNIPTPPNPVT